MACHVADWVRLSDLNGDPHTTYARLRATMPVAYVPAAGLWLITRWDDARALTPELRAPASKGAQTFGTPSVLTCDGVVHRAMREALLPGYRTVKAARRFGDVVAPIAHELIDAFASRGSADLVSEYFEPLSVRAFARLLGLGGMSTGRLRGWLRALAEGSTNSEASETTAATVADAHDELRARLEVLTRAPDGSAISDLLHAGRGSDGSRAPDEVLPTLLVMIIGGMQEPAHAGAGTVSALLSADGVWRRLRPDRESLLAAAVDEGLRLSAPVGLQVLETPRAIQIRGTRIPSGELVGLALGSINRDAEHWPDPDRIRLDRPRHVAGAFGLGAHACPGRSLARREMVVALGALLQRLRRLELDTRQPSPSIGWEFRGPRELHVRFAPG